MATIEITADRHVADRGKASDEQGEDAEYLLSLAKKGVERK